MSLYSLKPTAYSIRVFERSHIGQLMTAWQVMRNSSQATKQFVSEKHWIWVPLRLRTSLVVQVRCIRRRPSTSLALDLSICFASSLPATLFACPACEEWKGVKWRGIWKFTLGKKVTGNQNWSNSRLDTNSLFFSVFYLLSTLFHIVSLLGCW